MIWRVTTENLRRREPDTGHTIGYINSGSCVGVYAVQGQGQGDGFLWKVVPTRTSITGHPIFALYNKLAGVMNLFGGTGASPPFSRGYQHLMGKSTNLVPFYSNLDGIIFPTVTDAAPQLQLRGNGNEAAYEFSWINTTETAAFQVITPNVFRKDVSCQFKYLVGWQENTAASGSYNDPNDYPLVSFQALVGIPTLFIPNPFFESTPSEAACLNNTCNSNLSQPWPTPCLNYVENHPRNEALALLLTPRCTQGTAALDRVIRDRMCSYWCQAGLRSSSGPGNQEIHDLCLSTRRTSCTRFYDPDQESGWKEGTSAEDISACSCYMPLEFYSRLLEANGAQVPMGTSPTCFYQPCSSSNLAVDYWDLSTCAAVEVCIQQGGESTKNSCRTDAPPDPIPGPTPGDPGTDPTPTPTPTTPVVTDLSWLWWLLGGLLILTIIIVIVVLVYRGRQVAQEASTSPLALYLLSRGV